MSLKTIYERFLQSPNPLSLAEDATLHYVTTLTTFTQQGPIIRHLENQNKNVLKKRVENIISAVTGRTAIALEIETTLDFLTSGGAYLPGLDNFIVDRSVTLQMTHFVHFDQNEKITQIRISWDQGDMLRQAEVIGARGKNWPIKEGKDQIKLIARSTTSATAANPAPSLSPRGRSHNNEVSSRNVSPNKKHIKDPHSSLDLFDTKKTESERRNSNPNAVAPRISAKPQPREMSELFAAGHEDFDKKTHKDSVIAPKGAGVNKFQPSRLFEDDSEVATPKIYKTNPARYNHFDIGDAMEDDPMQHKTTSQPTAKVPMRAKIDKNMSHWNFEDVVTPAKVPQKIRDQDKVHFSYDGESDREIATPIKAGAAAKGRKDAESHFTIEDDGTPIDRPAAAPKPRPDSNTHFDFKDEHTPAPKRIIGRTKAAAGLYKDLVHEEDEVTRPLSTINNNAGRKNDFQSHWRPGDVSPINEKANTENKSFGVNKMMTKKTMDHWESYDQSPDAIKPPSNSNLRKGMESHWSMGGGEEGSTALNGDRQKQEPKSFWDF